MGHKVNPIILRIGFIKTWNSRWFANVKDFPKFIEEDYRIRKLINKRFKHAAISKVIIERLTEKVKIRIFTARPGIIIGRHGADIEKLREELNAMAKKEIAELLTVMGNFIQLAKKIEKEDNLEDDNE